MFSVSATSGNHFPVLLVGVGPDGCSKLASLLHGMHCEVETAATCRQAVPVLLTRDVPVVVSDPKLPDGDWATLLEEARRLRVPPSVIVVSDTSDSRLWTDVLTRGGFDVLPKPWTTESVAWMIQSAYRRWQRAREVEKARQTNALTSELR